VVNFLFTFIGGNFSIYSPWWYVFNCGCLSFPYFPLVNLNLPVKASCVLFHCVSTLDRSDCSVKLSARAVNKISEEIFCINIELYFGYEIPIFQ